MYIKEENGKIIIYKVVINNDIKMIRDELIEKYTTKTEFTKELTNPYNYSFNKENKNGKTVLIDYKRTGRYLSCNDFYSSDEEIYECRYMRYEYPDIVLYINELLDMNFENLPKLKDLVKPRKFYRLNDSNREFIKNVLPYKEYIKKIIDCIKVEVINEVYITSLDDLIELLIGVNDYELNQLSIELSKRLNSDFKKLSYLMGKNND